jgi:pimeloyl-ACP methyl ester carboxylesterase
VNAAAALRSRFVMAGGIRTSYAEAGGDGPTIVACHGGGAGSSGAAGMGRIMPLLAPTHRVVAPDSVGGFGFTDVRAPVPYGVLSRVHHLEAFVDALCLDRFTIMGNSQGAWIAAKYAMLHPDRVERIVLIASATIGSAMGFPEEITPAYRALLDYDYTREGMRTFLAFLVHDKSVITDQILDLRFASASRPGAREAFAAHADGNRYLQTEPMRVNFDMRGSLPTLAKAIPTVMFWGDEDVFAKPELGRALEPLLPAVRFEFVPRAGHQVQSDRPELLAERIVSFARGEGS